MNDTKKDTVEISKVQLDGILARLEGLEKEKEQHALGNYSSDEWREVSDEDRPKTATIRTLDGKYAIDWKFDRKVFNEKTRDIDQIYKITFLLPNDKEEITEMNLKDFALLERVEVKLIDKDLKKIEKIAGKTNVTKLDYENYRSEKGRSVDLKVTAYKTTFTVELPDKRQIKLAEGKLNA